MSIYVVGHKNPDTDSICAAIGYAAFKRAMGEEATAIRCGDINKETQYALDYFNVAAPKLVTKVEAGQKLIQVDHNEVGQSVPGLEQAELVAVVDHHRLADVQTGYPVYVRNEPVGSTNTIIATMFQENGVMPGEKLAGLMAAAIVSDTVMFKSPTTTPRDRRMAERLAKIAGLDLEKLGQEVFSASSPDKSAEVLIGTDLKEFNLSDHYIIISQITTMDSGSLVARKEELLQEMERIRKNRGADMVFLMITDVLKEGTELLFLGGGEEIRQAFDLREMGENSVFIPKLVSRKKQMVPALTQLWG
jgi:manganese-dependent inorganic pyrophosphatase